MVATVRISWSAATAMMISSVGFLSDLLIGGDGADRLNGGGGGDTRCGEYRSPAITLTEDVQFSHLVAALNGGPIVADDDGDVDVLQGLGKGRVLRSLPGHPGQGRHSR